MFRGIGLFVFFLGCGGGPTAHTSRDESSPEGVSTSTIGPALRLFSSDERGKSQDVEFPRPVFSWTGRRGFLIESLAAGGVRAWTRPLDGGAYQPFGEVPTPAYRYSALSRAELETRAKALKVLLVGEAKCFSGAIVEKSDALGVFEGNDAVAVAVVRREQLLLIPEQGCTGHMTTTLINAETIVRTFRADGSSPVDKRIGGAASSLHWVEGRLKVAYSSYAATDRAVVVWAELGSTTKKVTTVETMRCGRTSDGCRAIATPSGVVLFDAEWPDGRLNGAFVTASSTEPKRFSLSAPAGFVPTGIAVDDATMIVGGAGKHEWIGVMDIPSLAWKVEPKQAVHFTPRISSLGRAFVTSGDWLQSIDTAKGPGAKRQLPETRTLYADGLCDWRGDDLEGRFALVTCKTITSDVVERRGLP